MGSRPPVSICLVTYNRAELLPRTLDSLLAQSFTDYELIISDDCSSDGTEDVCHSYAARDARIRYIRQPSNLGMPGNLNASLQAASGEYLANLHDGDIYRHDLIARWKSALDSNPSAGFVFNAYLIRGNARSPDRSRGVSTSDRVWGERFPPLIPGACLGRRLMSNRSSCVFGTVMARRTVYDRVGWFDATFGEFSDVDMWMRIARDYDVAYVDEPLIELMPRDPARWYAFIHWRVNFWVLGIQVANLARYSCKYPELTRGVARGYRRRRLLLMLDNMLKCVKHGRWDRVKEGLAMWRDADDPVLHALGTLFGRPREAPDWYDPAYWRMATLPSGLLATGG